VVASRYRIHVEINLIEHQTTDRTTELCSAGEGEGSDVVEEGLDLGAIG